MVALVRLVLVLALLLSGNALCGQQAGKPYRLGLDPWIAWAPLVVADAKGFFAQEGVRVELVCYVGGETVEAFAAGKLDLAAMMAGSLLRVNLDEVPATAVAEIDWSHGGDKIVVPKGADAVPAKGKRIGIYEDSPAVTFFLHRYLQLHGARLQDYELVTILDGGELANNFLAGRFAAMVNYEPYVQKALAGDHGRVVTTTAEHLGVMPEVLAVGNARLAQLPPSDLARMLRGWIRAVAWTQDPQHRDELRQIVNTHMLADDPVTPASLQAMLDNVRIHDRTALRARNGKEGGIRAHLHELVEFVAGTTPAAKQLQVDGLVDTSALTTVLDELDAREAKPQAPAPAK